MTGFLKTAMFRFCLLNAQSYSYSRNYTTDPQRPLRHGPAMSNNSSFYPSYSRDSLPDRSRTAKPNVSNNENIDWKDNRLSRGRAMASTPDFNPAATYGNVRRALRPLENDRPRSVSPKKSEPSKPIQPRTPEPAVSYRPKTSSGPVVPSHTNPPPPPSNLRQSRKTDLTVNTKHEPPPETSGYSRRNRADSAHIPSPVTLTEPDLDTLKRSTTSHMRTLSEMSNNHDFERAMHTPVVTGLQDRRQFKRADTVAANSGKNHNVSIWSDAKWVDKQRHFLQTYEYLCHIGEAKEWIEDVIQKPIAATIELEEALRDGVVLAEIVQTLYPHQTFRIFRHPRLQYRHTDNIALFFVFLDQIELPDIFRFEMIDLYEKKNIPKVIYCLHALSWLLYKSEIIDFHIGNLVGQLEFEHHDLEEMQKGLDKAGIKMPSFSGVSASFGDDGAEELQAAPDMSEPLVVESEEKRIQRELLEYDDIFLDFQAQAKGATARGSLSQMMEDLWNNEVIITDFQSRLRGDWARQIISYRLDMRRFAVSLQSFSRGLLCRLRFRQDRRARVAMTPRLIEFQSIFRANRARSTLEAQRNYTHKEQSGIKYIQSIYRGAAVRRDVARELRETKRHNSRILLLQCAIRGFSVRRDTSRMLRYIDLAEPKVELLRTKIRGMLLRKDMKSQKYSLRANETSICSFQAYARGLLERRSFTRFQLALEKESRVVAVAQSAARGFMSRIAFSQLKSWLIESNREWLILQSFSRGELLRRYMSETKKKLVSDTSSITLLQAFVRGRASRNSTKLFKNRLEEQEISIKKIQSFVRGYNMRDRVDIVLTALDESTQPTLSLQSKARGYLLRQRHQADKDALESQLEQVIELEGLMRGALVRVSIVDLFAKFDDCAAEIEGLQALASGSLVRVSVEQDLASLDAEEDLIADFQTRIRGFILRGHFEEKRQYYLENISKVVKVQSIFRGKAQGEAYRSLTSGKNPPVATVKGFVHLLNDSDFDFDEEIEFERMRKATVQQVRQNEVADQYVSQLDIKIALLVRNKITLDEVVKHQRLLGGNAGALITNSDISSKGPFDLKAMNKNSRQKLEKFQELYFYLQTQPQYLAKLCRKLQEQALPEKELERTKHLFMGLFGYAQKRREEYYLVKLMVKCLQGDIRVYPSLQEYKRYNPFWDRLFGVYSKSPKDRKFLRDVFGGIIKDHVIGNPDLDLESDPLQIYQSIICEEELQTGRKSMRPLDIPREDAVRDPQTREIFVANLQDLRDIVDQFYMSLEENLHRMPFGVRHIAQMIYESLITRFPEEDRGLSLQLAGRWIWRSYLRPALLEPERHGAADRGLTQEQKRNLADIAKVVEQAVSGRLFGNENVYLQPLNPWLANSIQVLGSIWARG